MFYKRKKIYRIRMTLVGRWFFFSELSLKDFKTPFKVEQRTMLPVFSNLCKMSKALCYVKSHSLTHIHLANKESVSVCPGLERSVIQKDVQGEIVNLFIIASLKSTADLNASVIYTVFITSKCISLVKGKPTNDAFTGLWELEGV